MEGPLHALLLLFGDDFVDRVRFLFGGNESRVSERLKNEFIDLHGLQFARTKGLLFEKTFLLESLELERYHCVGDLNKNCQK